MPIDHNCRSAAPVKFPTGNPLAGGGDLGGHNLTPSRSHPRMTNILLVTGGGRGIGAATARLAGARGYAVAVNYLHNREAAEAVVADIAQAGGTAIAIPGDVASEEDVLRLFAAVDERLGPLTALVNNAGILDKQTRL